MKKIIFDVIKEKIKEKKSNLIRKNESIDNKYYSVNYI